MATTAAARLADRDDEHAARVQRRTRQILQAATRLMQESGFHAMSMQSVADAANMSVGLIYKYFGNKEDVLRAVIVDILEDFRDQVPAAMQAAGDDPVQRFSTGFRVFCQVVDAKRDATILTYRESKTLSPAGRRELMRLELETTEPIRQAVRDGVAAGVFGQVDVDLVVHNTLLVAHGWALKHWHLRRRFSLEEYIDAELELLLASMRPAARA
jgi:AcrR family transcriptional regulator